jgi:hypothetical protein
MSARLVVVAVFVLAAAAAGDAFRGGGADELLRRTAQEEPPDRRTLLLSGSRHPFVAAGPFLQKRVLRGGREFLSAEAVERAFPGEVEGPLDISKVVVAPDGTLVLAVYHFPPGRAAVGALQFWRDRRVVGAFRVPPGYFGGGLAFNRDGSLVALFSHDGQLRGVYDRRGDLKPGLPDSFLTVTP